jgi:pyruvate formate lyase activating enzyme
MQCNYCEWRCEMPASLCRMYEEKNGKIVERYPEQWTTYFLTSAETIPLFHGWPNNQFLQLGAFNCNAGCAYCLNARVAIRPGEETFRHHLTPEEVVKNALKTNCNGIHFGINEVTVNLPSALAVAGAAKKHDLVVGCSSNGYFTMESAMMMLEHFDFFNLSLKSLSDEFYKEHLLLESVTPVKRNIEYLAARTHLEITTPVVQTVNDHELLSIASYLASIDPQLPWHIFRLLPEYKMENSRPTDIRTIAEKVEECRKILPNTYFSNYIGSQLINTTCPRCGELLIERICAQSCGAILTDYHMEGNVCPACGAEIRMAGSFCDTTNPAETGGN